MNNGDTCDHANWRIRADDYIGMCTCDDCGSEIPVHIAINADHQRTIELQKKIEEKLKAVSIRYDKLDALIKNLTHPGSSAPASD